MGVININSYAGVTVGLIPVRPRELSMRILFGLLVIFTLGALTANAQWFDRDTGTPQADTKWRKSVGELGLALVLTGDANSFLKEWTSTPESHAPNVPPRGTIKRGSSIWALLFFSGCAAEGKSCNAIVDFRVLRPDGSVYGEMSGNKVSAHPTPKKGIVLLSSAYLQIRIEPQDPLGTYKILAVFRQADSSPPIQLEEEFDVTS
jgi:hypothetical protein